MHVTSLAALEPDSQRDAINRVYQGYLVPFQMTSEQLARYIEAYDVAREHSPVWLDDSGDVIAMAALCIRDDRGWVGGFGIAPRLRGQGFGGRLMTALLAEAAALGLRQVQLEMLTENVAAIRLYERAGFTRRRTVRIFGREATAGPIRDGTAEVHEIAVASALDHAVTVRSEPAVWQREGVGLGRRTGVAALAAGPVGTPHAVVIYSADEADVRLLDLAGDPAAARALLAVLVDRYPLATLRLGNEPAASPLCALLEECGWRELVRQHEMVRAVGPAAANP